MLKAELGKELVVTVLNDIGILSDITKAIAEKGISIEAMSCWVEGEKGLLHLVTDDNLRAGDTLRKMGMNVTEKKVVAAELPHRPGTMKHLADILRVARIDIHHLYTSADKNATMCLVVLSTSDNDRAMVEINKREVATALF